MISDIIYNKEKAKLAIDFCPTIYPCKKCGYPVISGYRCTYCNDTNPNEENKRK
jgi:hypothetical protein